MLGHIDRHMTKEEFGPRLNKVIEDNLYFDDLLCSVATENKAITLLCGVSELYINMWFDVSNWSRISRISTSQIPI